MGIPQYTILYFRSSGFYVGRFFFLSKPLFEHITHVTNIDISLLRSLPLFKL